jgi:AcrR family transcriptional regulator
VGRSLPLVTCVVDAPEGAPATERKDAARNRQKILAAARELMERRGLEGVCMDELAAAAGVGKGTLYRRFADKHALFRALLDDDERVLQDAVRGRFGLPKDAVPLRRLLTLWGALVDFVVDHKDVLAAAEVEARSRAALMDSPPYHWRRVELARALGGCGVVEERARLVADAWLQCLAADIVRAACGTSAMETVRETWKALPGGLSAALPHPAAPATPGASL